MAELGSVDSNIVTTGDPYQKGKAYIAARQTIADLGKAIDFCNKLPEDQQNSCFEGATILLDIGKQQNKCVKTGTCTDAQLNRFDELAGQIVQGLGIERSK